MSTRLFFEGDEFDFVTFLQQKNYSQYILLAEANTNGFCLPVLRNRIPFFKTCERIVVPQGEHNKTLEICALVWEQLEQLHADRSTLLITVGGGMISDLGGFAASVYKRGIDVVHIPTTLLAMVDACYGGKTGIDFQGIKNNIGSFHQPIGIYIHTHFLQTLPTRVLKSGIAETIKHAFISDALWWQEMVSYSLYDFTSITTIKKSIETKIKFVEEDVFDEGLRQALNAGHTMGHAIEACSLASDSALLHGEAILLGLIHELKLSEELFSLSTKVRSQLIELKNKFFPGLDRHDSYDVLMPFLLQDKKNQNGIRMSLIDEIGHCQTQVMVSETQIRKSFEI